MSQVPVYHNTLGGWDMARSAIAELVFFEQAEGGEQPNNCERAKRARSHRNISAFFLAASLVLIFGLFQW